MGMGLNSSTNLHQVVLHFIFVRSDLSGGFVSPRPVAGPDYPSVTIDVTKLDTAWHGNLLENWVGFPFGFGERIYRYDHVANNPLFEDWDIGVRYEGVTFSNIYLGFPLYYMKQPEAVLVLKKALQDIF